MSGPDDFEDFLARRKPVFRRPEEGPLEPPAELDRIVLRRAREAIESDRPEPMYHGPRWGMPVALAATLLVALTVVLHLGMPKKERVPEVTVQSVSQQREPAAAPAPSATAKSAAATPAPADKPEESPVTVDLSPPSLARRERVPGISGGFVASDESARYAPAPPPPPAAAPPAPAEAQRAVAASTSSPPWRHDARAWRAEIDRLRAEGKTAEADAEQAEYNRQHRAYAVGSPDR